MRYRADVDGGLRSGAVPGTRGVAHRRTNRLHRALDRSIRSRIRVPRANSRLCGPNRLVRREPEPHDESHPAPRGPITGPKGGRRPFCCFLKNDGRFRATTLAGSPERALGYTPVRFSTVALAQWQSSGLWNRRLRVRAPQATPLISCSDRTPKAATGMSRDCRQTPVVTTTASQKRQSTDGGLCRASWELRAAFQGSLRGYTRSCRCDAAEP